MALRTLPNGSKYQINEVPLTEGLKFGSDISYDDLLASLGPKHKEYEMLTQLGGTFYSPMSKTLSSMSTPFYDWVMANGGVQDISKQFARWRTYGKPSTEVSSVFNPMPGVEYPGQGNTRGLIVLDCEHFKPQDVLAPIGYPNAQILLKSYSEPVSGGGFQYEWETLEKDVFIPKELFEVGRKWDRRYSITSYRDSQTAGSTDFNFQYNYLEFEVGLSTLAKEYSITEELHREEESILISLCDYDTDIVTQKLTNKLEMEYEMTYRREKELMLMTGRSSSHHRDINSQQQITTAPGFFEFLEEANVIDYNPKVNSLDMMSDLLDNFWFDSVPISQRNIMLLTGEGGLKLFHQWVKEKFGQDKVSIPMNFVLGENGVDPASGRVKYEYGNFMFFKFNLELFGSITVGHWTMLDDTRVFDVLLPGTNKPVSSYEFIAMDMGFGSPNIRILTNNKRDRNKQIVVGEWSPLGYTDAMTNPVFKSIDDRTLGAAYQVRYKENIGLAIDDVSTILRFRPLPV